MISIIIDGKETLDDACLSIDKNENEVQLFQDVSSADERIYNTKEVDCFVTINTTNNKDNVTDYMALAKKYNELKEQYDAMYSNYIGLCESVFKSKFGDQNN